MSTYNHVQHVVSVNEFRSIADLNGLIGSNDGDSVYVAGYYESINDAPWVKGGGHFVWDSTKLRTEHNGVTIISPTVQWDNTPDTLVDYHAGTLEIEPSGVGCWVRQYEVLNVHMAGAVGDGVVDDTGAFEKCAASVSAANNIAGAEGANIPRAPMCIIKIPAGSYLISSEIDTNNREVVWELDQAAIISGYDYLNGKNYRAGQRQVDYHHGTTDYACSFSIRANTNLENGAEVLGISTESALATYSDRDSVSLYVDNIAPGALIDAATATYTATTVEITAPLADILKRLRRGMIIDTKHATKWSAFVDSWNEDGSIIYVNGWYQNGGGGTAGTPPGTDGCVINAFTKVWSHNANVQLNGDSYANKATGFELGVLNNKGALDYANQVNFIWGYDAVSLGSHDGAVGFISRKSSTSKFFRGFVCEDATQSGFYVSGTPINGFWSEQTSGSPFKYSPGGNTSFEVRADGSVSIPVSGGSIALGSISASNTPYIDFNSSGNNIDYDARLIATGGTGTVGEGVLTCQAKSGFITTGPTYPNVDNTLTCGLSSKRWSNVYGSQIRPGNGTPIWTSGSGSPEGVITASIGSLYTRTDGGAGTTLYVKESGTGLNTGWIAK